MSELRMIANNPYKDELLDKAENAQSFEDLQDISLVMDYVDSVQVKAMLSPSKKPDTPVNSDKSALEKLNELRQQLMDEDLDDLSDV